MGCDDLIVWPDGVVCWGDELEDFTHKSDDYQVLKHGSPEYLAAVEEFYDPD